MKTQTSTMKAMLAIAPYAQSVVINRSQALTALNNLPVTLDAETVQRAIEVISNLPIEGIIFK